jgi:hypothetical protein
VAALAASVADAPSLYCAGSLKATPTSRLNLVFQSFNQADDQGYSNLINPVHPDFENVAIRAPELCRFDALLIKSFSRSVKPQRRDAAPPGPTRPLYLELLSLTRQLGGSTRTALHLNFLTASMQAPGNRALAIGFAS